MQSLIKKQKREKTGINIQRARKNIYLREKWVYTTIFISTNKLSRHDGSASLFQSIEKGDRARRVSLKQIQLVAPIPNILAPLRFTDISLWNIRKYFKNRFTRNLPEGWSRFRFQFS